MKRLSGLFSVKCCFFTIMMTVAPLTSFYVSKAFIFQGIFRMEDGSSYIYSAGVAVIVVHVILIGFIYVAFRDDRPDKKTRADLAKESTGKRD